MTPEARRIIKKYAGVGAKLGIEAAAEIVNNYVTRPDINEFQYGALVSFTENRGARALWASKLLRIINEDDRPNWQFRAAREFLSPVWCQWSKKTYQRLKQRRQAEYALFLTPELVVFNQEVHK